MTEHEKIGDGQHTQLYEAVLRCQYSYWAWKRAGNLEEQTRLRYQNNRELEALWNLLADDMIKIGRGHRRRNSADSGDSLGMSAFSAVIAALPNLQVDPHRNVRGLLLTIARRSFFHEHRKDLRYNKALSLSTSEEQMWYQPDEAFGELSFQYTGEPADPQTVDHDERIADQIDTQKLLQIVGKYWHDKLVEHDYRIMLLRWSTEPPRTFRDIARLLGLGWEEATVRQRHHRIMRDTRAFLRDCGLLGN